MRRNIKRKISITLVIAMVLTFMSGCASPSRLTKERTREYKINGKKYSSNVVDHYMFVKKVEYTSDKGVDVGEKAELKKIVSPYDMYVGKFGLKDGGTLVCSEDDFDKVNAFYTDSKNFDWYYIQGQNNINSDAYMKYSSSDGVDYKLFDELVTTFESYDPVYYKNHTDKLDLKIERGANDLDRYYYIKETSKDEFLSSLIVKLYYYEGDLYYFVVSMGSGRKPELEGDYYQKLDDKLNQRFKEVLGL